MSIFEHLLLVDKIMWFIEDSVDYGNFICCNKKIHNYANRWYVKDKFIEKFRTYIKVSQKSGYPNIFGFGNPNDKKSATFPKLKTCELTEANRICVFAPLSDYQIILHKMNNSLQFGIGVHIEDRYRQNTKLFEFIPEAFAYSSLELARSSKFVNESTIFRNLNKSFILVDQGECVVERFKNRLWAKKLLLSKYEHTKLLWFANPQNLIAKELSNFDVFIFALHKDRTQRLETWKGVNTFDDNPISPKYVPKKFYEKYKSMRFPRSTYLVYHRQKKELFLLDCSHVSVGNRGKLGCFKYRNNDSLFVYDNFYAQNLFKFEYNKDPSFIKSLQRSAFTYL